jgi:hypothetical protein
MESVLAVWNNEVTVAQCLSPQAACPQRLSGPETGALTMMDEGAETTTTGDAAAEGQIVRLSVKLQHYYCPERVENPLIVWQVPPSAPSKTEKCSTALKGPPTEE